MPCVIKTGQECGKGRISIYEKMADPLIALNQAQRFNQEPEEPKVCLTCPSIRQDRSGCPIHETFAIEVKNQRKNP